jgi:hypothetical protein
MEHETGPAETGLAETGTAGTGPAEAAQPDAGQQAAAGFPRTGEPRVDAALKLLDRLPGLPVAEHPELYEQVHAQLAGVLGELDSGAGGAAGPRAS